MRDKKFYKEATLNNTFNLEAAEKALNTSLQNKLDGAYAQMRELAADTVKSNGGVKILSGETSSK